MDDPPRNYWQSGAGPGGLRSESKQKDAVLKTVNGAPPLGKPSTKCPNDIHGEGIKQHSKLLTLADLNDNSTGRLVLVKATQYLQTSDRRTHKSVSAKISIAVTIDPSGQPTLTPTLICKDMTALPNGTFKLDATNRPLIIKRADGSAEQNFKTVALLYGLAINTQDDIKSTIVDPKAKPKLPDNLRPGGIRNASAQASEVNGQNPTHVFVLSDATIEVVTYQELNEDDSTTTSTTTLATYRPTDSQVSEPITDIWEAKPVPRPVTKPEPPPPNKPESPDPTPDAE